MPREFGQWFAQQRVIAEPPAAPVLAELPEGFDERSDGSIYVDCCKCGTSIKISDYLDRDAIELQDAREQYCGGSPMCCP